MHFEPYRERRPDETPDALEGVVVRPAAGSDADSIGTIAAERDGGSAAEHAKRFAASLEAARDDGVVWVAEHHGRVVGFGRVARFVPAAHAPSNAAPAGYYLAGVIVERAFRRRGIGRSLTVARLDWIARRADRAYYFANARNRVSIHLHAALGFTEVTRDFDYPGTVFEGGVGILFVVELARLPLASAQPEEGTDHGSNG